MSSFNDLLKEQLKDPQFKAEWDALEPEYAIVQAIIDARKRSGLTQKELSGLTRQTSAALSGVWEIPLCEPSSGWPAAWE